MSGEPMQVNETDSIRWFRDDNANVLYSYVYNVFFILPKETN